MLVSITLTAATACTARACTKRLIETQWPETRDQTYWAKIETYCSETRDETQDVSVQDRDVEDFVLRDQDETLVHLMKLSKDRGVSTETTSLQGIRSMK